LQAPTRARHSGVRDADLIQKCRDRLYPHLDILTAGNGETSVKITRDPSIYWSSKSRELTLDDGNSSSTINAGSTLSPPLAPGRAATSSPRSSSKKFPGGYHARCLETAGRILDLASLTDAPKRLEKQLPAREKSPFLRKSPQNR